ncbi:MAG: hypothetical protein Kow0090_09790 [Myxococcota bacterium]
MLKSAIVTLFFTLALTIGGCEGCETKKVGALICKGWEVREGGRCLSLIGDACISGDQCRSEICVENLCTVECVSDIDCPVGYGCVEVEKAINERYCLPDGNGEGDECNLDEDCPEEYICEEGRCVRWEEAADIHECAATGDCELGERCFEYRCLAQNEGVWGEPCDPYSPNECAGEGISCVPLSYTSGICAAYCDSRNPCKPNQICRLLPGGYSYCLPSEWQCFSDALCPEGSICKFAIGGASQRVVGVCSEEDEGGIELGEECVPSEVVCKGGVCPESGLCSEPCGSDGDCPPGFLCDETLFATPSGAPTKALACVDMLNVKSRFGERCSAEGEECRAGLCFVEGDGGAPPFCTIRCDPTRYDCPYGYSCASAGEEDLCLPDVFSGACSSDNDCGVGQVCGVAVNSQEKSVEVYCAAGKSGGVSSGSFCDYLTGSPFCENGYCEYPGICGGLCGAPGDCPTGLVCGYSEVNRGDGVTVRIRRCVPDTGSQKLCLADKDCPQGEMCALFLSRRSTYPHQRCITAGEIGKSVGEQCNYSYECKSLLCTQSGRCTTLCRENADCPDDHFCGLVLLPVSETLYSAHKGCVFNEGNTGELGAPCPNGAIDCGDGLSCYNDGQGTSFCTKQCLSEADCAGELAPACKPLGPLGNFCQPEEYEQP